MVNENWNNLNEGSKEKSKGQIREDWIKGNAREEIKESLNGDLVVRSKISDTLSGWSQQEYNQILKEHWAKAAAEYANNFKKKLRPYTQATKDFIEYLKNFHQIKESLKINVEFPQELLDIIKGYLADVCDVERDQYSKSKISIVRKGEKIELLPEMSVTVTKNWKFNIDFRPKDNKQIYFHAENLSIAEMKEELRNIDWFLKNWKPDDWSLLKVIDNANDDFDPNDMI